MPQINIAIPVGSLKLDAVFHYPNHEKSWPVILLCHPHPRAGGDMNNNVVLAVASALEMVGLAVLRYNYRGVGKNKGAITTGPENTTDAIQIVDFLTSTTWIDPSRIAVGGYSFGGRIAVELAHQSSKIQALCGIGTVSPETDHHGWGASEQPKLFVIGDLDQFIPQAKFLEFTNQLAVPKEIHVVPGADHFFRGHENTVGQLVASFFHRWLITSDESR